ncbi:tetraacyldisaccharide 4'-kinase [Sphingobacterium lactis]|uniref:tetraacyldisaccharide 4'-kinase n=1 Tax=Sphingobacterium lactis TaxID=797291 RepID=UPI003F806B87
MQLLRWLLFPFTILYTCIIWLRNKLYDWGIFKTKEFPVASIVIGNLAIGGAGKSPLTQKLIGYFKDKYQVATLSRGYGRKTKGFRLVQSTDNAELVGDEPLQFKKNYPEITVAVNENRAEGIEILQQDHNLILLDDAYQHRKFKAKCNILVFDYQSIINPIVLLPTGNFRDTFNQTKRADCFLISKCPDHIPEDKKQLIEGKISKYSQAPIYYSKIKYLDLINLRTQQTVNLQLAVTDVLLLTGIANPSPLIKYVQDRFNKVEHIKFPDHHDFKASDYQKIVEQYNNIPSENKIILTTEKDAQRIDLTQLSNIPLYYIPIDIAIDQEAQFLELIENIVNKP